MNIIKKLTISNLKLNKKRTIVTSMGIILSVALICAVAGMLTSFQGTMLDVAKKGGGDYHVSFNNLNKDNLLSLEKNQAVKSYFVSTNLGYAKIKSDNENKPFVYVMGYDDEGLKKAGFSLIEGKMPDNDGEIVISKHLNSNEGNNYKIGDEITFTFGKRVFKGNELNQDDYYDPLGNEEYVLTGNVKTYKVVGIMERPGIESYSAPGYTVITKLSNLTDNYNIYITYKNVYKYAEYTKNICLGDSHNCPYDYNYNAEVLRWSGASLSDSSLTFLYTIGSIVIGIILISSVFVIKNSFSISLVERIKEYGMLSSVGSTSKQLKKSVLYEGFILGLISIPIGILCGLFADFVLVKVINLILKDYLGEYRFILCISYLPIIISIIIGSLTIYLSSFLTAKKASKISPIDAIRSNNDVKIKANKLRTSKLINKLFGIGGVISSKNLKRSKKKYRTTVVSLVVSIVIFIALSTFITYGFKLSNMYYYDVDYDITIYASKIDDANFQKLINLDEINKVSTYQRTFLRFKTNPYFTNFAKDYYLVNEGEVPEESRIVVYGLDDKSFTEYAKSLGIKNKDGAILIDGNGVYQNKQKQTILGSFLNLKEDSYFKLIMDNDQELSLKISKVTSSFPFGLSKETYAENGLLIVSSSYFKTISDANSKTIYMKANNLDKLDSEIKQLIKSNSGFSNIQYENISDYVKESNALVLIVSIFLYGFITVISLIGVTNIFNTITTNMNLRSKEFAMLKSIGMTSKEFNKMIRLESILYGLKSLLIGIPLGLGLSYLIHLAFKQEFVDHFIWPIKPIIISIIFVFLIVFITMKYSLNKINKQNIIETIRNENI